MAKLLAILLLAAVGHNAAQECVRANSDGGDSLPFFADKIFAPQIDANPIQAIIKSYQFHCCGKVGGWAAYVEPGSTVIHQGVYSIKFQIWRPSGNNRYVKIGENSFPLLTLVESSRIEEELSNSEQLDFQPGDVVGYYLEDNNNQDGGVQFNSSFDLEELWYTLGNSALQDECLLEVGSAGDLSISTNLGPVISISLTTTANNCPSTFTSTMSCLTPTVIPPAPGTPVTVADCLQATDGTRALPTFVRPGLGGVPRFTVTPVQVLIPSYQFTCAGEITEWRAFVERSNTRTYVDRGSYSISFQVWRPPSVPDGSYTMIGVNDFPSQRLSANIRGLFTGVPPESERIEVQPGDVVGFYLETSQSPDNGIQFAIDSHNNIAYNGETVWFDGTRCSMLDPPCVYSAGDFASMTNLAPLITVTVVSTLIIPSSTLMTPQVLSSTPLNIVPHSSTLPIVMSAVSTPPVLISSSSTLSFVVISPVSTPPVLPSVLLTPSVCNGCPIIQASAVTTSYQPSPTLIVTPTQPSAGINLGLYVGVSAGLLVLVLLTGVLIGLGCMELLTRRSRNKAPHGGIGLVSYKNEHTNVSIIPDENTEPSTETNLAYGELTESTISDYNFVTNLLAVTSDPSTTTRNPAYSGVTREEVVYAYIESDNKDKEIKQCEETEEPSYDPVVGQNPAYGDIVKASDDDYYINEGLSDNETKTDHIDGDKQLQSEPVVDQNAAYGAVEGVGFTTDPPIPTRENQAYLSVNT